MIGTTQVKNAPADGYTILLGSTSTLAANPSLYKSMTYEPSDFTTVGVNGTTGNFMLVKSRRAVQDGEGVRGVCQGPAEAALLRLRQRLLARPGRRCSRSPPA